MENIGNPWCFLGVSSTKLDPLFKTFDHLLWLSLFLVLLVLALTFENEVSLMVDRDEEVQWDKTGMVPMQTFENNYKNFIVNPLSLSLVSKEHVEIKFISYYSNILLNCMVTIEWRWYNA